MKIIINRRYGGFSISHEAAKEIGVGWVTGTDLRVNPELIKLIEDGKDCNGFCAKLKVVEIPSDATDYEIDDYDGMESIICVVNGKLVRIY